MGSCIMHGCFALGGHYCGRKPEHPEKTHVSKWATNHTLSHTTTADHVDRTRAALVRSQTECVTTELRYPDTLHQQCISTGRHVLYFESDGVHVINFLKSHKSTSDLVSRSRKIYKRNLLEIFSAEFLVEELCKLIPSSGISQQFLY